LNLLNTHIARYLYGFLWIRSSGVPFFSWFSPENANEIWNINELFFSGFFSAISSSSEVFFNDDPIHYIEFTHYKILLEKNANKDLFVVIADKESPDEIPIAVMNRMLEYYFESNLTKINEIQQDDGIVEEQFLQILFEVDHEWLKTQKNNSHRLKNGDSIQIHELKPKLPKTGAKTGAFTISNENQLEQKNIQLKQKIGVFSSVGRTLGHTLNNVLSTILGNINLSKLDVAENTDTYESLEEAEQACLKARNLISQLLNISKSIGTASSASELKNISNMSNNALEEETSQNLSKKPHTLVLGQGKVLLMDDDESILDTARKMITRLGYQVELARNFIDALQKYRNHKEKENPFNAVILDFSEIGGAGEFGSLILKNLDNQIKAIVSSGFIDDPIFSNYKKYGYSGVLKKPYNLGELSLVLSQIIQS